MRGRLRLLVLILILAVVLYPLIWMVGTSRRAGRSST
jgi:multiple sugar transport system permease protein